MLVSNWKENTEGFGVWTATNCVTEGPKLPTIIEASTGGFGTFGLCGEILNCGEAFDTFEDAAKFLESMFTWSVMLNGHDISLSGDNVKRS